MPCTYQSHFGFEIDPFRLTPDTRFVFWSEGHRAALATLEKAIAARMSCVMLAGDAGTGKSTLLRYIIASQELKVYAAHIWQPKLLAREFDHAIQAAFGIHPSEQAGLSNEGALGKLVRTQSELGYRCVLFVDEAQSLGPRLLDELFQLGHDVTGLTVVLSGQGSLTRKLKDCNVQPDGPIIKLSALGPGETADYVRHRLAYAGMRADVFDDDALAEVHRLSQGVPRLINILSERCMFMASSRSLGTIDKSLVSMIASNTDAFLSEVAGIRQDPNADDQGEITTDAAAGDAQVPGADAAPDPVAQATKDAHRTLVQRLRGRDESQAPSNPGAEAGGSSRLTRRRRRQHKRLGEGNARWQVAAALCAGLIGVLGVSAVATGKWRSLFDNPRGDTLAVAALSSGQSIEDFDLVQIRDLSAQLPQTADDSFRLAITLAGTDQDMAIAAYSHAAALGHSRAAYYLGQIFETGDGVPVDLELAKAWYEVAAQELERADASIATLPPPETGTATEPVMLFGRVNADGVAELGWTSGEGMDPESYTIEFSEFASPNVLEALTVRVSAVTRTPPNNAERWRVVANLPDADRTLASDWQPLVGVVEPAPE